jgi:hypothetical protein
VYLAILCAVAAGCGTSAKPKADTNSLVVARNAAPARKTAEEEAAEKRAAEEEAAEKRAAERRAAEKKAVQEKAAANSYVRVKVEVELCGVLTSTDEAAILSIITHKSGTDQFEEVKWVLDFGEANEIRRKARSLDGKTVLVTGSAFLRGVKSETWQDYGLRFRGRRQPGPEDPFEIVTRSVLDLEPKVAVKSLVVASNEGATFPAEQSAGHPWSECWSMRALCPPPLVRVMVWAGSGCKMAGIAPKHHGPAEAALQGESTQGLTVAP